METLRPHPRRLERVAFREIASPTVTISLRGKDGETSRWNTYNCSACLRPVYHSQHDWLRNVVVWKHCPTFGNGLERLYTGTFKSAVQFDSDDESVTESRGPKISPYKILMHVDCFHQLIKALDLQPDTKSLALYLQNLLVSDNHINIDTSVSSDALANKAAATRLGLKLKTRVENLQCLRLNEHELKNPFEIPIGIAHGTITMQANNLRSCGFLAKLPTELLDYVLDYLSPKDFTNLRSTCSGLRNFRYANRCWKRALEQEYPCFEWKYINDWKYVYEHKQDEEMKNISRVLIQLDQISKWVRRS
ncbi:hypothetical protein VKS41_005708 [Umbelopsis sp. WA50703]